jgi:hypothetical protein
VSETKSLSPVATAFLAIMAVAGLVAVGSYVVSAQRRSANQAAANDDMTDLTRRMAAASTDGDAEAMNGAQREHIDLVARIREQDLDLPLPDADRLTAEEYAQVQADWRLLCSGEGAMQIDDHATPEAVAELHAMHARMLSGPNGRNLLHQILHETPGPPLKVKSLPADESTMEDRAQREHNRRQLAHAADQLRVAEDAFAAEWDLAHADGAVPPEEWYRDFEQRKTPHDEHAMAHANQIANLDEQGLYNDPAPGLATPNGLEIEVRAGMHDSENVNFDMNGDPIACPAFLVYGHELVHALRSRKGIMSAKDKRQDGWSNDEEFATIAGDDRLPNISENALRADHELPARHQHTGERRDAAQIRELADALG